MFATDHPRLSSRQLEVLEAIASGYSNDEIALRLGVSTETVKSHVHMILARLGARTRAHAVAIGFHLGVLTTTSPSELSVRSGSSLYERESAPSA